MDGDKSISFIIVNYNGKDHLKECFSTLNKLNYPKDKLEFIMVDNGSKDGSVQFVKSKYKNVKIIKNSTNEGFAKPNNDAAKIAKGDYIALINNDMKVDSNWINDMLATLHQCKDDSYVCVGSKILNWDGSKLDFAGGGISFYGHGYQDDFAMDIEEANKKYNEDRDLMFACGGAMIIDRKIFLSIGGFDEDYFAYNEDVDLGWRLWLLGYKVRFCHESICYHKHNSTSKKLKKIKLDVISNRNTLFTIYKNYSEDNVYRILSASLLIKSYNTDIDTEDQFGENKDMKIQSEVMFEFTNKLSKMKLKREYIQKNRKITDGQFIDKFMNRAYDNQLLKFLYRNNLYNNTIENLITSLNVEKQFGKRKNNMLIISSDKIGNKMAGPGIRYSEIAKQLSAICSITLAAPNQCELNLKQYDINSVEFSINKTKDLVDAFRTTDIVLIQGVWLELIPELKQYCNDRIIIVDLYDPFTIENLEVHKAKDMDTRNLFNNSDLNALLNQIRLGDYFICANEKQKDFWIGMLSALNKVNPKEYDLSNKLNRLIGLVPFGISEIDPVHTRDALKEKIPGLKENDKVFIWGGGVWNWFDPLSLISAIGEISKTRDDIKLFFLGVKHPNPDVPEMEMLAKAFHLSEELGIRDKYVIFNMDWVDYNDRQNFLLESYAGVSCHFDNLETRFSFRTRILDYLWASLPIIATEGDYFSQEVSDKKLGIVVKFKDVESLKNALIKIADDKNFYDECKNNIKEYREQYKWNIVTKPLKDFCKDPIKKQSDIIIKSYSKIADINQIVKDDLVGPIYDFTRVGQKFKCRYPNLTKIQLMVGTYARQNDHKIFFKLYDTLTNGLIIEKKIDASLLVDNSWLDIEFEPILNSEGRQFYFYIKADENASEENSITVFRSTEVKDKGSMMIDGSPVEGSLTYRTECIFTDESIDEEKGIIISDNYSLPLDSDGKVSNKYNESLNLGNIKHMENSIRDMQEQVNNVSANVYKLNKWKKMIDARFNKLKRFNILGFIRNNSNK
ncbi:glycosyltransferase [Clostridium pasteurianum]|uniref:Putative glycosyltransferase n=1 Tax=Clostridium pasteurianum BC1 TaxID=86416 RepID=R4K848_CLOPA|nr:glycosyltransferase [Clostridium pasteurianum]AGK97871.1 putative glycosyltransferase [Clostridium pasteurianum BC1]